jgi:hypothetical protein
MRIAVVIIAFFAATVGRAQEGSPRVEEMPEFVITGKKEWRMPIEDKERPEPVSLINDEFLRPLYPPDKLEVKQIQDPIKTEALFDTLDYVEGDARMAVGSIRSIDGALNLVFPLSNETLIRGGVYGDHRREFVEYGARSRFGIRVDAMNAATDGYLGGAEASATFAADTRSGYHYGSPTPDLAKTATIATLRAGVKNTAHSRYAFGVEASDRHLTTSVSNDAIDEGVSANMLALKGFFQTQINYFELHVNGAAQAHSVGGGETNLAFHAAGYAGFNVSKIIRVHGGVRLVKSDYIEKLNPQARFAMQPVKGITLIGEYRPTTKFLGAVDLIESNFYYDPDYYADFVSYDEENAFLAAIKYEFERFFEINGGVRYFGSDAYPYFTDAANLAGTVAPVARTGRFAVALSDVDFFTIFGDFMFHPGPMGMFYGELKLNRMNNDDGNAIPYHSAIEATATYSYGFLPKWTGEATVEYKSSRYADAANQVELDGWFDLGASVEYEISENVRAFASLDNMLSAEYQRWRGYDEPGFSAALGIEYIWR